MALVPVDGCKGNLVHDYYTRTWREKLPEAPPPSDSLSLIMNTNVNCCRATSIHPGLRIADEICGDA